MLLIAAPPSNSNKNEQNNEKKRVIKKLSEQQMSRIREENEAENLRRIEREAALSEVTVRDVVQYDSLPLPKEVKSISDINSILDYQTSKRKPVSYDKEILTNQEGVTSTMTEQVKQGRYPDKEIIENEQLHKINQILSEHRFKKYFAHLEDEKAHELRKDSYVKIKEFVKKEQMQFLKWGDFFGYNRIFNDIDSFVIDEKVSEASIQTTFENFDGICAEHGSETMNGILTWPIFDKYIQKADAQKHQIYKKYITRNLQSRKELFDAIDSIDPALCMALKSAAQGGISALDVIKFKVAYQVIAEDWFIEMIPEEQQKKPNKNWGGRERIRQKIKSWARRNIFEDKIQEEKAQITESVHNGFLNQSFLDKDGVSYWHTIVKRAHTRNLNFIEVLILEPYNRILNPISMNDWVKRNGFTREQVLQEAREKMTKSFEFDQITMNQIYYLNFDQLMSQSQKIEQITQKAYLAFENVAYLEHLKHKIKQTIKEWLFKKIYRLRYVMSRLNLKINETCKPKKTYEPKSSGKFPFKKFSMDRTVSQEHFINTFLSVEKFRQAYDRAKNMINYQDWNEEQEDFLCRQIDYQSFKRCLWMDPAYLSEQQTMSHFEETFMQGQRFLRTLKSQNFQDLEDADFKTQDEIAKDRAQERKITRHMTNKELLNHYSKKWKQKALNQYVMRFYHFDHVKLKFERQHESFHSIQIDNRGEAGYNIDVLTTLRNNTYFFRRDIERNCFYLYRHQMSTPPINGAQTEWDKLEYKNKGIEEKLGEYAIQMDVDTPVEDMQIVFLKPAHQFYSLQREQADDDETTFLHKQFVAVFLHQKPEKTNLQIYYLKSPEKPILDYGTKDINFQAGWYIRENETDKGKIKFIIKGVKIDQTLEYEFRDESLGLGMLSDDNPKIIKQNRDAVFKRSNKGMYKLIHRELLMKWTSESFVLTYFHGHNQEIENIQCLNPIRGNIKEQLPGGLRNKEQEIFRVLNEINQMDYQKNKKGPWLNIERDFNDRMNDMWYDSVIFKNDQEFTKFIEEGTEYHHTDDMLIQFNRSNDFIQIYRCSHDMTWLDFKKNLQAEKEMQNVTQLKILEQFDQRNQETYQDNYSYQSQFVENRPNQYIKQLYKHRIFSKVITTHNSVQFMGSDYKVDEDFLLIDLDGNAKGHLSMIKLYQDEFECHRVKWGLKLMKYQVSFSKKKVFFAFQALNKQTQAANHEQQVNQSGLYFFVVKELDDVKKLVRQTTEKDDNYDDCLLNKYQYINVFYSAEEFKQFEFGSGANLKQYQDNYLYNFTACTNHIQFEVLHDTAMQDIAHIVPFIFLSRSSARQRKKDCVSGNRMLYRPYMTLIDFSKFKQPLDSQSQNHHEYSKFIYINQFKYQHENTSDEEDLRSLFYFEGGAHKYPVYQFSRCSNWQKNIKRRSYPQGKQNKISARFQIGLYSSPIENQLYEIRDIMITIDLDEKVQKVDLKKLQMGVKVDYVGMKYLFGSSAFKHFNVFEGISRFTFSHYLIPKIDNEGNINGTYFMFNVHGQESKPIKLKSGKDFKNSFQKYKDDVNLRWDRKYHQLEGQWVNPVQSDTSDDTMCVLAKDGIHYWVGYDSIECYDKKTNHDIKNYKSTGNYIENQKKAYAYVPVEMNNDVYDKNLLLETNLAQLGISKQVVFNQPNQFLMVVSTKLLDDVIKKDYLDKNMQMLEIHRLQQQMMCMSFINFREIFRMKIGYQFHQGQGKTYFQPRQLFNGQSLASNDFPMFLTSIENLSKAMSYTEEEANNHISIENSPLDVMCGTLEENNQEFKNNVAEFYFKMMGFNKYQNFFYDLNNVSIIQRGLDLGYIKPVQFILNKISDYFQDGLYQDLIMRDLPQLMCQVDVQFNDFVNRDALEEEADDQEDENAVEDCNIEVKLREPELPFMGPTSIMEREFHEFDNIFDLKQTIEEKIIEDFQTGIKIQQPELNWNLMLAGIGEGNDNRILVDYYLMNFLPSIQKIKIDLMMNRKDKEGNPPVHLERFSDIHPADYNSMDDFIMADYIDKQRDNESFFEQSSICKLIDRQFQYTRVIYLYQLFTLIVFFLFPFIYGILIDDRENPKMRILLFVIGGITQFLFFLLELIEVYQIGTDFAALKEYFVGWNVNDFTVPFNYTAHVFFYYYWHQYEEERKYKAIIYNLITISVLAQSIFKCLQYVRVIDSFGFLVEMIISVIFDLFPFVAIFFLMVTFFSFGIHTMGGKFDDGDYLGLPKPILSWIQMFRNSIGDIAEVGYGVWERPEGYVSESLFCKYNGAIITIWTFWFLNMFIMLIVIVNFLIAEVSQTYDKVKSSGKTFLYLSKASVNKIAFDYRKSLGYIQEDRFVAIVFKSPRDLSNIAGGGDEMFGFTTAVRNELKKLIQPFKNELLKHLKKFSDTVEMNKKGTEWQMALQKNALTRLAQQTDVLKEHNDEIHKTCRGLLQIIPNLVPLVEKAEEDK